MAERIEVGKIYQQRGNIIFCTRDNHNGTYRGTYILASGDVAVEQNFRNAVDIGEIDSSTILGEQVWGLIKSARQEFLDSTPTGDVIILDGNVYALRKDLLPEPSQALTAHIELQKNTALRAVHHLENAFNHLSRINQASLRLPAGEAIAHDIRQIYIEVGNSIQDELPAYILPCPYQPKYLSMGGEMYQLDDNDVEELNRPSTYLIIKPIGSACLLGMLDSRGRIFTQYHGGFPMCTGNFMPLAPTSSYQLTELRDQMTRVMQIVNADSPMNRNPPGLPTLEALVSRAKRVEQTKVTDNLIIEGGLFKSSESHAPVKGDRVEILYAWDSFPRDCVGSIGTVVDADRNGYWIEFLFEFENGHRCGGRLDNCRGYYFGKNCVRLAESNRALTRIEGIWNRLSGVERANIRELQHARELR